MDILSAEGATGERDQLVWAFVVTGVVAGGVIGATAAFGVALENLTHSFAGLSFWTLVGWGIGTLLGGAAGLLGGRLTRRLTGTKAG